MIGFARYGLAALTMIPALAACAEQMGSGAMTSGIAGMACPELRGGAANASFAADAQANATIRAFVEASGDLATVADRAEAEVAEACVRIGRDLGVPEDSMRPANEAGGRAAGACRAVRAKIDAILQQGANARVSASYTPPECRVQGDAYAACAGQCNGSVDPGYVVAHCTPAELSGTCEGACEGQCDGACSAKNASGQCNGQCSGTCHSHCNGTWKAPHCATQVKAPEVHGSCDASCKAHANLTAACSEPRVDVKAAVDAGEMGKLIATLRANLPALIRAEVAYGQRITGDVQVLVDEGGKLPNAFGQIGGHAAACVAAAADVVVHAQASLRVSVQASAEVSGRVGAHAG